MSTEEPSQEGHIVVTTEDGHALTDEELSVLLAQQGDGVVSPEEGSAQIVDDDGNVVSVSAEQLASAGIDINNIGELSEEQLSSLLQLANSSGTGTPKTEQPTRAPAGRDHKHRSAPSEPQIEHESSGPQTGSGDLTMVLGEDGSLRLVDPSGTEFLLTADQLTAQGIDISNLTEDQVQTILQLAMTMEPLKSTTKRSGGASGGEQSKRMKMSSGEAQLGMSDNNYAATVRGGVSGKSSFGGYGVIGQEVEVKKGGKTMLATIRYCRQGAGYKVQFEDGHFEWVSEDQILLRESGKSRTDHESYTGDTVGDGIRERQVSAKVPNGPPVASTSSAARRVPPAIPGIRVSQPIGDEVAEGQDGLGLRPEPNFACPICEKKVYQKEPAYIVIRLPACDTCADSKILVLDEETAKQKDSETDRNDADREEVVENHENLAV